jgi:hypothetical protein
MRLGRIAQATGVALAFVYLLLGRAENSKKRKDCRTRLDRPDSGVMTGEAFDL